ncbi:biotin/lipoyl-containing protein, partial [Janibacter melonis]|uniref:biotin/lipoyl-containing protein n=1 Tax=Janibacter melonis TaxID=262209 RepID=UPI0029668C04
MALQKFNLPDPGEGLTEADLVTWRVAVGDEVKVNDMVVEVETAKSLVELPIPFAGRVVELLAAEGDTVDVGAPIIVVDTGGEAAPAAAPPAGSATADEPDEASGPNLVGYGAKAGSTRRRARRGEPAQASLPTEQPVAYSPAPPVEATPLAAPPPPPPAPGPGARA